MNRRFLCAFVALFVALVPITAWAQPLEEKPPMELNCAAALLMEASTGRVVFEMNADERRPVASVIKVMPILLALEAVDQGRAALTDKVSCSKQASGMGGSQVLLEAGGIYRYADLLKSMIVSSANDATVAMGEYLYGSEDALVSRMNERAKQLGLSDTNYVNSTGLPAQGQYTTARDIATLSRELLAHKIYFEFSTIWMDELRHAGDRITELTNTNRLIRIYDGADGFKTGSTNEAGYCMSATAKRGDNRFIAVVLGAKTGSERFAIAGKMMDHGFANYQVAALARKGDVVEGGFPVTGGDMKTVELVLGADMNALLAKGQLDDVRYEKQLPVELSAPLSQGTVVGSMRMLLGDQVICEQPLIIGSDVPQSSYGAALRRVVRGWFYR